MKNLYRDWMNSWERRLADKDTNRQVQPFSWGLEWLDPGWCDQIRESPLETIKEYSAMALSKSEEWYAPPPMADEAFQGSVLTFRTPTPGKIQENNLARCTFFPADDSRSAVIVVPQWNARRESHFSLCRLLARLGINAIRLTLPYHEGRNLPGAERADFMLGPNIGRTLHSTRQAVLEVRQVFNWLKGRGFDKIGIVGTSLGSCVAFLAFVHEPGLITGVFNHASSFYAEVVWHGMATQFVKAGLEGNISARDLRSCWSPLSPWYYIPRLKRNYRPHLLITAAFDMSFPPKYYRALLATYRRHNLPRRSVTLPCGHYTLEKFPFMHLDGWHITTFLKQHLN